jgi:CDGSH-type Zn-finger protein
MIDRSEKKRRINVTKDGPYLVSGGVPLARERMIIGSDGEPEKWEQGPAYPNLEWYALCRCGRSKNKPYCDGSHARFDFDGTETAGRSASPDRAERTSGPALDLTYDPDLCAEARFCHHGEGAWSYTERSDDPDSRNAAIGQACACPSGSLVAWDKASGSAIEPELEPSISVIENPGDGRDGPLWVKGGIPIESSNGVEYEIRNRVTLCRCGRSRNKPFCDGSHKKPESSMP